MKFQVKRNRIMLAEGERTINCNSGIETHCEFSFDDSYQGCDTFAVFYRDHQIKGIQELKNNRCKIPWELYEKEGLLYIGAYGIKMEGTELKRRLTTNAVFIKVEKTLF